MALETEVGVAARNAMCDALADLFDAGSAAGYLQVRSGAAPANCGDANSGTLLATLPLSDPAFGAASTGVATANAITDDSSADASDDAGHFRGFDSDNVCHIQGTAGESGDTPNMVFGNKSIVMGGVVEVTAFTITIPAAGA
jgi:hypothetical protein